MAASLRVDDGSNGVRVLTLSNPSRRNALDAGVLEALRQALKTPAAIRALVIRGEGGAAFSAGYDLNELAKFTPGDPLPDDLIAEVLDGLSNHVLPTVGLLTGAAFGAGCELAMACDVRVGDASSKFCMPPVKLGLVYSRKGFERIAHRVGISAARFLFLTGRVIDAQRALQLGLIDLLEPDGAAETTAMALAMELAAASAVAIRGTKLGLHLLEHSTPEALSEFERLRLDSYSSEETRARVRAMVAKAK